MQNRWLLGLMLLVMQTTVLADERQAVVDLTTQQYRVESLQSEHYKLKVKQKSLKEAYTKQQARVKSLEKSLAEAKKTLADNKSALQKHDADMKVFDKKLAVEEQKLNAIWDQTHRRKK